MSKKAIYFLGILLTILLGTYLYWIFCCSVCCGEKESKDKELESKIVVEPSVKAATKNAFIISDATGGLNTKINDNFNFRTSSFSIINPVSEGVTKGVLELKDYLLDKPLKTVDITGYYKSDEKNNSAFPNLGLGRANAVKNYFVRHGISGKQMNTISQLNNDINPDETNTLFGPIKFDVLTSDPSDTAAIDALKSTCDAIKDNPLTLHFKKGQAAIDLTVEQRRKIADISHCVDQLEKKILVIGHTDNSGNANGHIGLGQKRADFAKDYLIKNGILEENIITSSKGEVEPVADNTTEEGRAKNRRTVITIN